MEREHGDFDAMQSDLALKIRDVSKIYDRSGAVAAAVKNVSLDVRRNEFVTIVGPSGCGKTTLLRMIAGFEDISSGSIFLNGSDVSQFPPERRPINTVFQHYALFPHLTVRQNVEFGLRRLKWPAEEVVSRAQQMLALVQMERFRDRKPQELSGGQQQRVALARALAPRPDIVLLDEPLAALDLKLRQSLRAELKRIQKAAATTFIFVTHDQEEALSMSDRVAVMYEGEIQQVGPQSDIYNRPVNRFVAEFIGDTNIFDAHVEETDGLAVTCRTSTGQRILASSDAPLDIGTVVTLSLRPEDIAVRLVDQPEANAQVVDCDFLGNALSMQVMMGDNLIKARCSKQLADFDHLAAGQHVFIDLGIAAARVLRT